MLALDDEQMKLLHAAVASLDSEADRKHLLELVDIACRVRSCDLIDAIRRALREVRAYKKTKWGDLTLPANFRDVTSEKSGQMFGIVGPPFKRGAS